MRLDALRRRARTAVSGRRGSAQLGLVLAAAAAAGGMTLGSGVASQDAKSGYDLAWLADGPRGQLVQVDPVLGRANVRLQVAGPGSNLSIQQGDGHLVVIDRNTGKITSIDLGTLLVGGTRSASPGEGVKVLLAGERLYVADLPRGTIQAVDPATQADIGLPWKAGRPLVDVGVDGTHDVWSLDSRRTLTNLRWNGVALAPVSTRAVEGAGPGSVIVGHDRGITLVGSGGAVVRVGTGKDSRLDAPRVRGPLHGPGNSPTDIVPVSDPTTSSVVIVGPRDAVVDDVSVFGCDRPAAPTVFDGKVYVPCTGAHKVIVLDPSGGQVGSAIPTPTGGEPQLTVSGGHLVIDVPGSGKATIVDASGGTREFPTVAPGIGVQNPNTPPPDPPAPPKPEPSKKKNGKGNNDNGKNNNSNGGGRGDGPGTGAPGTGTPGTGAPASGNPVTGGSAEAAARPDGSVLVSWDSTGGAGATVVTDSTTGDEVATVPAGATSATVTVLAPGTTTSFVVRNATLKATTNAVTTSTRPGAVTGVTVTSQSMTGSTATVTVTWTAATANGSTISYAVSGGGSATKTTNALTATIQVPCVSTGCSGTVTVTPRNSAGAGTPGSAAFTVTGGGGGGGTPAPQPAPTTAAPQPAPTTAEPAPQPTTAPAPQPTEIAMPSAGAELITTTATPGNDSQGTLATAHVTVNAPSDWVAFGAAGGSCALYVDSVNNGSIPCGAQGETRDFGYGESGTHEFWIEAENGGRSAESAHRSQSVVYRQLCLNSAGVRSLTGNGVAQRPICDTQPNCPPNQVCQIPFANIDLGPARIEGVAAALGAGIGRRR